MSDRDGAVVSLGGLDVPGHRMDFAALRDFEERVLGNLGQIRCPVHLSLGAEWVSEEISRYIRPEDWLFSTHRNHGHYLAKGGSQERLWEEICGLAGGVNRGLAGSQCYSDPQINFHASSIVGGGIGIATGVALALKGSGRIVLCCFGDAAVEEGVFWESLNFAALKKLPILFICENNGLSINVPFHERQARGISERVKSWVMVETSMQSAFEVARAQTPCFMEIMTQREGHHCYFPPAA